MIPLPGKNQRRRILFFLSLVALAMMPPALARDRLWLVVCRYRGDFTTVSLEQSPYLRNVSEPIVFIKGVYEGGSDDHWMRVTFEDTRQNVRTVDFIFYVPGTYRKLVLGKEVPVGGLEEGAFLGLLQRWYWRDAEIRLLRDRVERWDRSKGSPIESKEFTEPQKAKLIAHSMMRVLLKRD